MITVKIQSLATKQLTNQKNVREKLLERPGGLIRIGKINSI